MIDLKNDSAKYRSNMLQNGSDNGDKLALTKSPKVHSADYRAKNNSAVSECRLYLLRSYT